MRKMFFICLNVISFSLFAQNQLTVDEAVRAFNKGEQPSFQIDIPQVTLKDVEKDWLKYLSNGSKGKATVANGENFQPAAVNKNISPNPFNVYSKLLEISGAVRITAWFTEDDSVFISTAQNNDQSLAVQKYVRDFAVQQYREAVQSELKSEQDKLKALEKELDGFVKDENKSINKINANKRAIERANDDIATANRDIQNTTYKIEDQKRMVEKTASDPNANKGAKKTLSDLENEKKKSQKAIESAGKNIDKLNAEIRSEERAVSEAKAKQAQKQTEIEAQKQKTAEVQAKLDGIK